MPFDSEGIFTRIHNWEDDRVNDIEIVSDSHDEEDDNFAAGLSQTVLRDGRAPMTGNLNLANFQIQNIGAGTRTTDAVNKSQLDTVNTRLTTLDGLAIHLAGAETITGVKTFSVSPLVPTAATSSSDTTAASTALVDNKIKNASTTTTFMPVAKNKVSYAAGTHTAPANGVVYVAQHTGWGTYKLTNNTTGVESGNYNDSEVGAPCSGWIPVAKGDIFISTQACVFCYWGGTL